MELQKRVACVEIVSAQFQRARFEWGRADCVRLAAAMLRAMGHNPGLAKAGSYSSALGAKKALQRLGFGSIEDALDARGLARIAPASAWPGDIIALAGEPDWPALTVCVGNGRVLGFYDGECQILQPVQFVAAWRVECLK